MRSQGHISRPEADVKVQTLAKKEYLGTNLPKQKKRYIYRKLLDTDKRNQEHTNIWRDTPCSWIGRINIVILITINILSKINILFKAT